MTETCPEELVVPLVADKLPAVLLQPIVLLARGLLALSFNVAVNVVELPLWIVKLDGEIDRDVGTFSITELTVINLFSASEAPPLSVTVSTTAYVLGLEYLRVGFFRVLVVPSPKFQYQETIVPSLSVDWSVNWIVLSVVGEAGEYVKAADGGVF